MTWRLSAPAVLLAAWGGNHFSPLLLMYRQIDGYTAVEVNTFFAFYVLGLVPGFLVAGPLSDRHGRKRLVVGALALGVLGSVVLAFGSAHVLWMCVGRLISGLSVSVAMVVGTSWIKELSGDVDPSTRARRASLTLTAGFGLGAGISGALAQWGPAPTLTPYAVQIGLSLLALPPLLRAPEAQVPGGPTGSLLAGLRVPAGVRRRFATVVLPMAPWVFAAPALAFVVAPAVLTARVGDDRVVAFAAFLALLALCCGAAVQPFVPWIARLTHGRHAVVGLAAIALATAILAVDTRLLSAPLAVVDAVLFGIGYGICLVAGLVEAQAMADPGSLAGLTGIYYSLTYIGFGLPVALSGLARLADDDVLLGGVAVLCVVCALIVTRGLAVGVSASVRTPTEPAAAGAPTTRST